MMLFSDLEHQIDSDKTYDFGDEIKSVKEV